MSGIYFLFDADEIVYVGQAWNIENRIRSHVSEGVKVFDSYAHLSIDGGGSQSEMDSVEAYFIYKFQPKYNIRMPLNTGYLTLTSFLNQRNYNRAMGVTKFLCAQLRDTKRFWHISELEQHFAVIPKKAKNGV